MIHFVELGQNMAILRDQQGLSVEEVAFRARVCEKWWHAMEQEHRNTSIDTMQRVAQALNVEPLVLVIFSLTDAEIHVIVAAMVEAFPDAPIHHTTDIHPGSNVLWLREHRKMTQKKLAMEAKISTARLRDIEHCCANTTIEKLEDIAAALGVSLFTLYALTVPEQVILDMVHAARKLSKLVTV